MKVIQLSKSVALTVLLLLSGCFSKGAIRPPDILRQSSGKSIVMLSTSARMNSVSFAQSVAIMKVGDDGKKIPITAYFTDNAFEKPDMPEDHTNFRWLALDPGAYVVEMEFQIPSSALFKLRSFSSLWALRSGRTWETFVRMQRASMSQIRWTETLPIFVRMRRGEVTQLLPCCRWKWTCSKTSGAKATMVRLPRCPCPTTREVLDLPYRRPESPDFDIVAAHDGKSRSRRIEHQQIRGGARVSGKPELLSGGCIPEL